MKRRDTTQKIPNRELPSPTELALIAAALGARPNSAADVLPSALRLWLAAEAFLREPQALAKPQLIVRYAPGPIARDEAIKQMTELDSLAFDRTKETDPVRDYLWRAGVRGKRGRPLSQRATLDKLKAYLGSRGGGSVRGAQLLSELLTSDGTYSISRELVLDHWIAWEKRKRSLRAKRAAKTKSGNS